MTCLRVITCAVALLTSLVVTTSSYSYVAQDGSFNYVVDVSLPGAPAKHRPDLRLSYNSNSAGEYLGRGWSLLGLTRITRMDFGRGIRFSPGDTFVGPEGRLVQVSTDRYYYAMDRGSIAIPLFSGAPGISGTCYGSSQEPCAWKVTDRIGTTSVFGGTEDSRIDAYDRLGTFKPGRPVRVWAVSSVRDVHGNTYFVRYWKSPKSGEYYPREIRYAQTTLIFSYCDKLSPF